MKRIENWVLGLPKKIFLRECLGEQGAPESALTISSKTFGDMTSSIICNGQTAALLLLFSAKESRMSNNNSQHLVKSAFGHFCVKKIDFIQLRINSESHPIKTTIFIINSS